VNRRTSRVTSRRGGRRDRAPRGVDIIIREEIG